MPGRTFDTRPLYKLPTTPRCRSRSMKISATRSSSRIATRVSWALEEMIISLVIPAAPDGSLRGRHVAPLLRRYGEKGPEHRQEAAQEERDGSQRHGGPGISSGLRAPGGRLRAAPKPETRSAEP